MKSFLLIAAMLLASACSSTPGKTPSSLIGFTETGQASFYAMKYQSRQTASGERLNQSAKTAAHRTLPFGTRVRVTGLDTGDSVVVKITDRGPFIDGRVIDLTRSAFSAIGNTDAGVIDVSIEVIR